jgi:hypothetical protein
MQSWRIVATAVALVAFDGSFAQAQPLDPGAASGRTDTQKPLNNSERLREALRRLDLPPDPKLDAQWRTAYEQMNLCLEKYFVANAGAPDISARKLGAAGCVACDKEIIIAARLYIEANKHRFIKPDFDHQLADDRQFCATFSWLEASKAIRDFIYAIAQRTSYGDIGAWRIEGRVANGGLLSYVLSATDDKSGISVEIVCQSADQAAPSSFLLGPFKGHVKGTEKSYVTYSVDGDSVKQAVGYVGQGRVRLAVDGVLWSVLRKTKDILRISVQGLSAQFSLSGFPEAEYQWRRRCGS